MSRLRGSRLFFAVVVLMAGTYGVVRFALWLYYRYTHAVTEDAFVEADIVNVSPLVPGHIKEILVDESQRIRKGQLLFVLDDKDYAARVALAKAQVRSAKSRLKVLREKLKQAEYAYALAKRLYEEGVRAAELDLKQVQAQFERVVRDFKRFTTLYKKRVVGRYKYDRIVEEFKRVKSLVGVKRAQLAMAEAKKMEVRIRRQQVEELKKEIEVAERELERAKRALKVALVNLEHTRVRSPIDGVVAKRYLQEGDFAAAGYPVLAVYDTSKIYVLANLEETRFEGVRVGNEVDIRVDAYPGKVFKGRVMRILPASAAKFALIPRDVTAGEFTKVVQRIPIKIALDDEAKEVLIPGMSVEVGIKR